MAARARGYLDGQSGGRGERFDFPLQDPVSFWIGGGIALPG